MKLSDAKELLRAGVEGWLHTPVRGADHVDEEIIAIVKDRIAKNNRPNMWTTPGLHGAWMNASLMNTPSGQKPAWLDDPLLKATYSPASIDATLGRGASQEHHQQICRARIRGAGPQHHAVRAAGMKVVMGTDTGQNRHWIGYFCHIILESFVGMGMTPMDAIIAATRYSAEVVKLNTGMIVPGRQALISSCSMPIRWRAFPVRGGSTRSTCGDRRFRAQP